jgi:hypothetical protein
MSVAVPCTGIDCPSFRVSRGEGLDQDSSQKVVDFLEVIAEMLNSETITFGHTLDEALLSLYEVYNDCSQENWDGYGALTIPYSAYEEAKKIIKLLPSSIQIPEIIAEPNGEIGFEWRRSKGQVFVISIGGKHRINYAGIFGDNKTHGSEYFEEAIPSVIIENLRRLYS